MPPVSPARISLPDRYRVVRHLASGGMAAVWEAHDELLDRDVAVKILAPHLGEDERARRRFQREARAAAGLSSHPHVVTIYDVGEHAGRVFMVMEIMRGGTLSDRVKSGREIDPATAARWLREAAEALGAADEAGVVHRDIKPGNLLLDGQERLAIADFGIARVAWEDQLTLTGQVLGTAAYISPEQAMGEPATAASDRYSLAVVAYELLTGSRPFEGSHFAAQARAHVEDPPPPPSSRRPGLSAAVDAVIERALAKNPHDRYPSATAFTDALDRALSAPETAATRRLGRRGSKRAAAAGGAVDDRRRGAKRSGAGGDAAAWESSGAGGEAAAARESGDAAGGGGAVDDPRRGSKRAGAAAAGGAAASREGGGEGGEAAAAKGSGRAVDDGRRGAGGEAAAAWESGGAVDDRRRGAGGGAVDEWRRGAGGEGGAVDDRRRGTGDGGDGGAIDDRQRGAGGGAAGGGRATDAWARGGGLAGPGHRRGSAALLAGVAGLLVLAVVAIVVLASRDGGGGNEPRAQRTPAATKTATADKTPTASPTASPSPSPSPTPDQTVSGAPDLRQAAALQLDGYKARQAGDYATALEKARAALAACGAVHQLSPCGYALFEEGVALNRGGDPAAAIPILQQRLDQYGDNGSGEVSKELRDAQRSAGQKPGKGRKGPRGGGDDGD